jgi:hypothetical protein
VKQARTSCEEDHRGRDERSSPKVKRVFTGWRCDSGEDPDGERERDSSQGEACEAKVEHETAGAERRCER